MTSTKPCCDFFSHKICEFLRGNVKVGFDAKNAKESYVKLRSLGGCGDLIKSMGYQKVGHVIVPYNHWGFIRGVSYQRDTEEPDRVAPCFKFP